MLTLLLLACAGGAGDDKTPGGPDDTGPADDQAAYETLAAELAGYRTAFLDEEADELWATGNNLFWLEFPGFDPVLHRWDANTDVSVEYGFSIGSDTYNYRASRQLVVTAEVDGGDVVYHAYDATTENTEVGSAEFEGPTDGTRWHAYAVDGENVYLVVVSYEETAMYRWTPPGRPSRLWSFDELGYELGAFQDFGVEDGTMVFLEGGRIWRADVSNGHGEWLGNETQVTGSVSFDTTGVMWAAGDGALYYFDIATSGPAVNVSEAINTASYALNPSYESAHKVVEDGFWRRGSELVYEGLNGIWYYRMDTGAFEPIILEQDDPDVRVTWRDPVLLENGTLFVTGLESESGSVGADGPVWRVDHPSL